MAKFIRPFPGMLLIEPVRETNSNGILFPQTAHKDLQSVFKVVAVGKPKVKRLKNGSFLRIPAEVFAGQKIVANTYAGKELEVDGKVMRLIHFDSVMAVLGDGVLVQEI